MIKHQLVIREQIIFRQLIWLNCNIFYSNSCLGIICCTHCIISWIYFIRIVIDVLITYSEGLVWGCSIWHDGNSSQKYKICLRRLIKSRSIFNKKNSCWSDMKTLPWDGYTKFQGKYKCNFFIHWRWESLFYQKYNY